MSNILRCENPWCHYYCKDSYALSKHRVWCQMQDFQPPRKRLRTMEDIDSRERKTTIPQPQDGIPTIVYPEAVVIPTGQEGESDSDRGNEAQPSVEQDEAEITEDQSGHEGIPSAGRRRPDFDEKRYKKKANDWMAVVIARLSKQVGDHMMSDLYSALRENQDHLKDFIESYPTVYKCKKRMNEIVNRNMEHFGYEKVEFTDEDSKLSGHVYIRDAAKMLRFQVSKANKDEFHFFPSKKVFDGEEIWSNIMDTELAREVEDCLRTTRKASRDKDVFWMDKETNPIPHFPALVQIYSDKTATSLKSSAMVGYPLHLTLLNFKSSFRRKLIKKNETVVGYLSEEYVSECMDAHEEGGGTNDRQSRSRRAAVLNEAMRIALKPIVESLREGLLLETKDGMKGKAIAVIANYTADIPEGKQMSGVLNGSKTKHPCIRCMIPAGALNSLEKFPRRTIRNMKTIRKAYDNKIAASEKCRKSNRGKKAALLRLEAKEELRNHSLFVVPSFLEDSVLLPSGLSTSNDVYTIFSYESLHNLHLGISKEIKRVIFERLGSESLRVNGRTLKSMRKTILKGVNDVLHKIDKEFYTPNLKVDHSKAEKSSRLNGFYLEDGIRGMLEAKDYQRLDMVFPFVAAYIDRACGEEDKHPITTICVLYSDLVSRVLLYDKRKQWSELMVREVDALVRKLRERMIVDLSGYHNSNFRTLKFHVLTHLTEDIRRYGGLHNVEAGTFENAHLMFKRAYGKTSKRMKTSFEETLKRIGEGNAALYATDEIRGKDQGFEEKDREVSTTMNPHLVRSRGKCTLRELNNFCEEAKSLAEDRDILSDLDICVLESRHPGACLELYHQCDMACLEVLCTLLREEMLKKEQCPEELVKIHVVKSGFISGGHCLANSTCFNPKTGSLKFLEPELSRRQRVMATRSFQNRRAFSFVAFKGNAGDVWVGQVRALLRVQYPSSEEDELAFVRYMDVIPPRDGIERTLDCVMLQWTVGNELEEIQRGVDVVDAAKMSTKREVMDMTPWLGLAPFDTILSRLHVVRTNYSTPVVPEQLHWMFHRFCINRFYYEGSENINEGMCQE